MTLLACFSSDAWRTHPNLSIVFVAVFWNLLAIRYFVVRLATLRRCHGVCIPVTLLQQICDNYCPVKNIDLGLEDSFA